VTPYPAVQIDPELSPQVSNNTPVTIFSHPWSQSLRWSKQCLIHPGSEAEKGEDIFLHQCPTETGSSGAAVIDDNTLKVVGIHNGGKFPWNWGTYIAKTPLAEYYGSNFNLPPVAQFQFPAEAEATFSNELLAKVEASDPDGTVTKVIFHFPDNTTTEADTDPYTSIWDTTMVYNGTYTLIAIAIDNLGAASPIAYQQITIDNPDYE
jgi:hypothetical protein